MAIRAIGGRRRTAVFSSSWSYGEYYDESEDAISTYDGRVGGGDADSRRGMAEAFTSLESLTADDIVEERGGCEIDPHSEGGGEDGMDAEPSQPTLRARYCRTDDTGAGNTGKSDTEEVESYLETLAALEGTTVATAPKIKYKEKGSASAEPGGSTELNDKLPTPPPPTLG